MSTQSKSVWERNVEWARRVARTVKELKKSVLALASAPSDVVKAIERDAIPRTMPTIDNRWKNPYDVKEDREKE